MKIRRTHDPNICYMEADSVALWCHDIIGFRVDTRNKKFLMTPILRDGSEWPLIDATDMSRSFCESTTDDTV